MAIRAADIELYFHSNTRGAIQGVNQLDQSVGRLGKRMTWFSAFATALAGRAITQSLFGAVGEAIQFETAMNNVNSIAKVSEGTLRQFGVTLQDMGMDWGQGPTVMAQALYEVQSAGFAAADGITILNAANQAAVAGITTSQVAADALTSTINAFGTEAAMAEHYANIMFRAVDQGKITFAELASTIGDNVSLAAQVGVSFEELGAAFAMATQKGVPFNEVSTQLNAIMSAFLKPSTDMIAALAAQGHASGEALLQSEGLAGALRFLEEATGGSSDTLALLLPNIRALRGATALLGGEFETFLQQMLDAQGGAGDLSAMESALEEQTKSTSFQVNRLKAAFSVLKIEMMTGALPAIKAAADSLSTVVKAIARMPEPIRNLISIVAMLTGGFIAVYGAIILFGGAIGTVLAALAVAVPVITAVAAAVLLLAKAWSSDFFGVKTIVTGVVDAIVERFRMLAGAIGPVFSLLKSFAGLQGELDALWSGNKAMLDFQSAMLKLGFSATTARDIFESLTGLHVPIRRIVAGFGQFVKIGKTVGRFLSGADISAREFKKFGQRLENVFGADIGKRFHDSLFRMRRALRGLGAELRSALFGDGGGQSFLERLPGIGERVADVFRGRVLPAIGAGLTAAMDAVSTAAIWLTRNLDTIIDVAGRVADVIGTTLTGSISALNNVLQGDWRGALDDVVNIFETWGQAAIDLGGWLINILEPIVVPWVADAAAWVVERVRGFFFGGGIGNLAERVIDAGRWVVSVTEPIVVPWITDAAGWFYEKVRAFLFGGGLSAVAGRIVDAGQWVVSVSEPSITAWAGAGFDWIKEKIQGLLGLGGRERGAHAIAFGQTAEPIDIGTLFVTGKVQLTESLRVIAADFLGWVKKELNVAPSGEMSAHAIAFGHASDIDIGTIRVGGKVDLVGELDDIGVHIATQIGLQDGTTKAEALKAGEEQGQIAGEQWWASFRDKFLASVDSLFGGGGTGGVGGGTFWGDGDIFDIPTPADPLPDLNFVDVWLEEQRGRIRGIIPGIFTGISSDVDLAMALTEIAIGTYTKRFNDGVIAFFEDIDFGDALTPQLPDWLTTNWEWITGPIADLIGYITELGGLVADAVGLTKQSTGITARTPGINAMPASADQVKFPGNMSSAVGLGWEPVAVPIEWAPQVSVMPIYDTTMVQPLLNEALAKVGFGSGGGLSSSGMMGMMGGGAAAADIMFTVGAETTAFDTALGDVLNKARTLTVDLAFEGAAAGNAFTTGLQVALVNAATSAAIAAGAIRSALANSVGFNDGFNAGFNYGSGLVAGVNSQIGAAMAAGLAIGNAVKQGTALAGMVASPSKAMAKLGNQFVDGFLQPFDRRKNEVRGVVDGVGNWRGKSAPVQPVSTSPQTVYNLFVLKSDEFITLQRNAEAGGQFARSFGTGARTRLSALGSK